MEQTPYIGNKISLISKLNIRYEGILYNVDSSESTITLKKGNRTLVRSFGTEARPSPQYVPTRNEIFDYIIFRANDVKDLIVCDTKKTTEIVGYPYDPAILSIKSTNEKISPLLGTKSDIGNSAGRSKRPYHSPTTPVNRRQNQGTKNQERNSGVFHLQEPQQMHNYYPYMNRNSNGHNKEYQKDFDFERANEQLQSELKNLDKGIADIKVNDENNQPGSVEETDFTSNNTGIIELDKNYYNKKGSFFDEISCGSTEKASPTRYLRPNKINRETFGMFYIPRYPQKRENIREKSLMQNGRTYNRYKSNNSRK